MEGYIFRGEIQMKEQLNKEITYGGDIHTEETCRKSDIYTEGKIYKGEIEMKK